MKAHELGILLSMAMMLASCDIDQAQIKNQSDIDKNYSSWQATNTISYTYKYDRIGFPLPPGSPVYPIKVTVMNKTVYAAEDFNGIQLTDSQITTGNYFKTIDQSFDTLRIAISGSTTTASASGTITVSYEPNYHFPSYAYIDWIKNAVDDEAGWSITEFSITN